VTRQPDEIRQRLGYLPQDFGFFANLSAYEMLDYIAIMKNVPPGQRKEAIEGVVESVGLTTRGKDRIRTYSGGMKQRLGIAQAILGEPDLLIVDEPTAGLDPEERIRFRGTIARLAMQRTVLLSTHIVADVEASCDQVGVLNHGRLVFVGTPSALAAKAKGSVWEVDLEQTEWAALQPHYHLIASHPQNGQVHLRVVGSENPLSRGRPLEPTVEDGYVMLVSDSREEREVVHG
jgi:ABC-type multidrug transport system ATPase subunit